MLYSYSTKVSIQNLVLISTKHLKQLKFILLHIRDSRIPGRDEQAGTADTKVLLAGTWPGPGPDMDNKFLPRDQAGTKN